MQNKRKSSSPVMFQIHDLTSSNSRSVRILSTNLCQSLSEKKYYLVIFVSETVLHIYKLSDSSVDSIEQVFLEQSSRIVFKLVLPQLQSTTFKFSLEENVTLSKDLIQEIQVLDNYTVLIRSHLCFLWTRKVNFDNSDTMNPLGTKIFHLRHRNATFKPPFPMKPIKGTYFPTIFELNEDHNVPSQDISRSLIVISPCSSDIFYLDAVLSKSEVRMIQKKDYHHGNVPLQERVSAIFLGRIAHEQREPFQVSSGLASGLLQKIVENSSSILIWSTYGGQLFVSSSISLKSEDSVLVLDSISEPITCICGYGDHILAVGISGNYWIITTDPTGTSKKLRIRSGKFNMMSSCSSGNDMQVWTTAEVAFRKHSKAFVLIGGLLFFVNLNDDIEPERIKTFYSVLSLDGFSLECTVCLFGNGMLSVWDHQWADELKLEKEQHDHRVNSYIKALQSFHDTAQIGKAGNQKLKHTVFEANVAFYMQLAEKGNKPQIQIELKINEGGGSKSWHDSVLHVALSVKNHSQFKLRHGWFLLVQISHCFSYLKRRANTGKRIIYPLVLGELSTKSFRIPMKADLYEPFTIEARVLFSLTGVSEWISDKFMDEGVCLTFASISEKINILHLSERVEIEEVDIDRSVQSSEANQCYTLLTKSNFSHSDRRFQRSVFPLQISRRDLRDVLSHLGFTIDESNMVLLMLPDQSSMQLDMREKLTEISGDRLGLPYYRAALLEVVNKRRESHPTGFYPAGRSNSSFLSRELREIIPQILSLKSRILKLTEVHEIRSHKLVKNDELSGKEGEEEKKEKEEQEILQAYVDIGRNLYEVYERLRSSSC